MRCLAAGKWGANRAARKSIYTGLIRSVLDYGCIVFGSASNTSLKKLDCVQCQTARLCLGAFRSTPTSALLEELGEQPLELRRLQLSLNYWIYLKGHNKTHPTQITLTPCWEKEKRETKSFGQIIENKAKDLEMNEVDVGPTVPLSVTKP